jgi:hypothetical protein
MSFAPKEDEAALKEALGHEKVSAAAEEMVDLE